ncbi:retrovirus-related pol polyprotein from transposon TNT 1-94 [Tanacetum coccineum]
MIQTASHLSLGAIRIVQKASSESGLESFNNLHTHDYPHTLDTLSKTKDETPEVHKDFLKMIHRNLQAQVIIVQTDRGIEFLNKILHTYFTEEGIEHQTSIPRTPEQNGVVKRRDRTLIEAARMMLSTSKLPLLFWAEAIATAPITPTTNVNAEENNNDQAADAQIDENEFYSIFSTSVREEAESSTRYVDNSNMHTFYQPKGYAQEEGINLGESFAPVTASLRSCRFSSPTAAHQSFSKSTRWMVKTAPV